MWKQGFVVDVEAKEHERGFIGRTGIRVGNLKSLIDHFIGESRTFFAEHFKSTPIVVSIILPVLENAILQLVKATFVAKSSQRPCGTNNRFKLIMNERLLGSLSHRFGVSLYESSCVPGIIIKS